MPRLLPLPTFFYININFYVVPCFFSSSFSSVKKNMLAHGGFEVQFVIIQWIFLKIIIIITTTTSSTMVNSEASKVFSQPSQNPIYHDAIQWTPRFSCVEIFFTLFCVFFLLSFKEMKSARKTNEWDYFWLSAVEATRPEEELNFLIS